MCCGRSCSDDSLQLAFADYMHELDACEEDAGRTKGFESEHWSRDSLNGAMILFDDIVDILHLSNSYRGFLFGIVIFDSDIVTASIVDFGRVR